MESYVRQPLDRSPPISLPLLDRGQLPLLEVRLDIRSRPLVEIKQLRDQALQPLLKRVSLGEDLRGVLQRRRSGDGVHQLPASRHQLVERRKVLIDSPHRNVCTLGDVLPGGAKNTLLG